MRLSSFVHHLLVCVSEVDGSRIQPKLYNSWILSLVRMYHSDGAVLIICVWLSHNLGQGPPWYREICLLIKAIAEASVQTLIPRLPAQTACVIDEQFLLLLSLVPP